MPISQEHGPTFVLRRICDKIQAKTTELLSFFRIKQEQNMDCQQNINSRSNEQTRICNKPFLSQSIHIKPEQSFIEAIKNDLCRIISSELPQVVNYEAKINDRIEDLEQEIEETKKQVRIEKQNYKESILETDTLKLEILSIQHRSKELADEIETWKEKYSEAVQLVNKYMKDIQRFEAENIDMKQMENTCDIKSKQFEVSPSVKSPTHYLPSPKYSQQPEINYPLQIKQKLNEAQKVLNRSPRSGDLQLQSSHFQLSSEIVGCQKELLQIQLKNAERQKVQLVLELQEERNYTKTLEKEVDDLEKLVDGEKKLNQKLDRELYTLINVSKEMKIELLEEKAKNKHLEQEIFQMEQAISQQHKEATQLQEKITQLQIQSSKITRLEDTINQLKAKLEISQKKYEQLRKIKYELEQKVQEFQAKLVEIEKKESQDQLKQETFHQTIKSQNSSKIKQIQEMSQIIQQKYQQKIQIMQKHYKELKEKCKYYKQQNARLYEGFQVQGKKQAKLQEKYQKTKQRQEQLEDELISLKKDHSSLEEKCKTQTLLSKELKRELINAEKSKMTLERTLKKLLISKLPNLLTQIKLMKEESITLKAAIQTYKEITKKAGSKNLTQFQSRLDHILTEEQEKFNFLQIDYNKKLTLLEHWKKQYQNSEDQKLKLIERFNSSQSNQALCTQQLEAKQSEITLLTQKISFMQSVNTKLQKQVQNFKKIQKQGLQQLQILREKQKEIEQFYSLIDQLTEENQMLKKKLETAISKHKEYLTFNKNQNMYHPFQYNSMVSIKDNESLPSYLIPQKQSKQKATSRSGESLINSHSCVHLRALSKNKSLTGVMQIPKSPSVQKPNQHHSIKHNFDQTIPNQLPIHSRPIMFNSRKRNVYIEPCQAFASEEIMDFKEQKNLVKYNFENQRQRLEEIKNEYQKMKANKFRDQFINKMIVEKGFY